MDPAQPGSASAKRAAILKQLQENPGGLAFPRQKAEASLVEGRLARIRAKLRLEGGNVDHFNYWWNDWNSWDQWSNS